MQQVMSDVSHSVCSALALFAIVNRASWQTMCSLHSCGFVCCTYGCQTILIGAGKNHVDGLGDVVRPLIIGIDEL